MRTKREVVQEVTVLVCDGCGADIDRAGAWVQLSNYEPIEDGDAWLSIFRTSDDQHFHSLLCLRANLSTSAAEAT